MHQKWFRTLLRRRFTVIILLLIQITFFICSLFLSSQVSDTLNVVLKILSFAAILNVISKKDKGAYKMMWVLLILIFPVFGGLMYLWVGIQSSTKNYNERIAVTENKAKKCYGSDAISRAREALPQSTTQIDYLQNFAGFPIYDNSTAEFLPSGECKFERLLNELEKAEKYIFLEYFIIQNGIMWGAILEILKRKASEGILVRIIYDDIGCFFLLPKDYPKQLEKYGIECAIFNPFRPMLTAVQNNRDHRKIVSIDGKTAFTGGINLADEYINAVEKHGHWNDSAIIVSGEAAWSFTLIFLQMWEICKHTDEAYEMYYPWKNSVCSVKSDGFIQPYSDSPIDTENVGEHVYLHIINNAVKYVYIITPYLIIDDSMLSALTLAAKSGVDVRIITPHIWDKFLVHMTTRSYYRELLKAGVKIYEYTNGFIHSKIFVSDDITATVGTANLDFRSLYLHFECGVQLYNCNAVSDIKSYYLKTLQECQEITLEDCKNNIIVRLFQDILRLFAPLM